MMGEKPTDKQQDDNPYTQEEYERDLAHSDAVLVYQRKLTEQLGHPVTLTEAEDVAYEWTGTTESRSLTTHSSSLVIWLEPLSNALLINVELLAFAGSYALSSRTSPIQLRTTYDFASSWLRK
jgi:hypothetical protein